LIQASRLSGWVVEFHAESLRLRRHGVSQPFKVFGELGVVRLASSLPDRRGQPNPIRLAVEAAATLPQEIKVEVAVACE
jgi:hypothetical protein